MKSIVYLFLVATFCLFNVVLTQAQSTEEEKPVVTKDETPVMTKEDVPIATKEEAPIMTKEEAIKEAEKAGSNIVVKPTKDKKPSVWKTLAKITFKKEYDELMGFKIDKPVFSSKVKALEGKEVEIKGYIIPVEGYKSHNEFIFSAFPYNMCFFCGGAGPETVMEVTSSEPVKYTAQQIKLKGKLKLNPDDINRLMYIMTDAVMIEIE